MLTIGLTGNIGSGKTMIAGIFKTLGIPVYFADSESKKFLEEPEVIQAIVESFGTGILNNELGIDKKSLSSVVFNNADPLLRLNSILHPKVLGNFNAWVKIHSSPYVIQEAAIIFESGIAPLFQKIIHVSCPKEMSINRVTKRDKVDGPSVLTRMQFQYSDEEKSRLADYVIVNDGTQLVIPQVLLIHEHLLKISSQGNDHVSAGTADA
jgi:dephospho-CoA kinase